MTGAPGLRPTGGPSPGRRAQGQQSPLPLPSSRPPSGLGSEVLALGLCPGSSSYVWSLRANSSRKCPGPRTEAPKPEAGRRQANAHSVHPPRGGSCPCPAGPGDQLGMEVGHDSLLTLHCLAASRRASPCLSGPQFLQLYSLHAHPETRESSPREAESGDGLLPRKVPWDTDQRHVLSP